MADKNDIKTNNNARNSSLEYLISQVQNKNTKDYITNRLIPQMEWYSRKGMLYKKQYYRWMTASIFVGALIPVVSVFADGCIWVKILLAGLGASVTACNAFLSLHNSKDLWLTYRNTRENLLRILYYYFNHAGIFSQSSTQPERDLLLINICEEQLSKENSQWMTLINEKTIS